MDLLTNAIESIQIGVEDWQSGSRPRLVSAIRNIHAGILLLYKEALLRLSPDESGEVLIKARMKPVNDPKRGIVFVGVGRKTVDTFQIQERFDSLGIATDWKKLKQIGDLRNDIEHYFSEVSQDSLRGAIASAFSIIRSFAEEQLEEEPRDLLGQPTWDAMLKATELYQEERVACDLAIEQVDWESDVLRDGIGRLVCESCGSDLLKAEPGGSYSDFDLVCRSCGEAVERKAAVVRAVGKALGRESYLSADDGADEPLTTCPSCFSDTYVMSEKRCASCGFEAEHECTRCGQDIPASEMMCSPLCGYCEHMATKDD